MKHLINVSVVVLVCILEGGALSVLWRWFVAKPFGLIDLTIPHAIGLTAAVTALIIGSVAYMLTW